MSIKIKLLSSVVTVFMLLCSLIIVAAQQGDITLPVGGTLSDTEPVVTNSYDSFGDENISVAIDPSISEPVVSVRVTSAPGDPIEGTKPNGRNSTNVTFRSTIFYNSSQVTPNKFNGISNSYDVIINGALNFSDTDLTGLSDITGPQLVPENATIRDLDLTECLVTNVDGPDSFLDATDNTIDAKNIALTNAGYDSCVRIRFLQADTDSIAKRNITVVTDFDLGTFTFDINDGTSGDIDFASFVGIYDAPFVTGTSTQQFNTNESELSVSTVSDRKAPIITVDETLSSTAGSTNQQAAISVDESINISDISVRCDGATSTIAISEDSGGNTLITPTLEANASAFVTITGGLNGGQAYSSCILSATDGNNPSTVDLGGFTFADTSDPLISSISAIRTNNTDALSNKYAKAGDTVELTVTFNEPIKAAVLDRINISGTALTHSPQTAPSDSAPLTSLTYSFPAPSANGSIQVIYTTFTDRFDNVQGDNSEAASLRTVETNVVDDSQADFFLVDSTAPTSSATFIITAASDTGVSDTDLITNDSTPNFTLSGAGTGERIELTITNSSSVLHDSTISNNGELNGSSLRLFPDGTYSISAVAIDNAGNKSSSVSTKNVVIDTTAPAHTPNLVATSDLGVSDTDNLTSATDLVISVPTNTSSETLYIHSTDPSNVTAISSDSIANNTAEITLSSVAEGEWVLKTTDAAGNLASGSLNVNVDKTAPTITPVIISQTAAVNTERDFIISAADETGLVDGYYYENPSTASDCSAVTYSSNESSRTTSLTVAANDHACIRVTDTAGNNGFIKTDDSAVVQGAALSTFVEDTGSSDTDRITNDSTPTIGGQTAIGGVVEIFVKPSTKPTFEESDKAGNATVSGATWTYTLPAKSDGVYNIGLRATIAGTTTPIIASINYMVDTTNNPVTLNVPTTGDVPQNNVVHTNDTTPTVTVSGVESGDTVVITAESTGQTTQTASISVVSDGTVTHDFSTLAEGTWTISGTNTDIADNVFTIPSYTVIVDTTGATSTPILVKAGESFEFTSTFSELVYLATSGSDVQRQPSRTHSGFQNSGLSAGVVSQSTFSNSSTAAAANIYDLAGNISNVTFYVDGTAPVVTNVEVKNGTSRFTLSATIAHNQPVAINSLEETVTPVFAGKCTVAKVNSSNSATYTPSEAATYDYESNISAASGSYDDCTVKFSDSVGNLSAAVDIDTFAVARRRGGGAFNGGAVRAPLIETGNTFVTTTNVTTNARAEKIAQLKTVLEGLVERVKVLKEQRASGKTVVVTPAPVSDRSAKLAGLREQLTILTNKVVELRKKREEAARVVPVVTPTPAPRPVPAPVNVEVKTPVVNTDVQQSKEDRVAELLKVLKSLDSLGI